MLSLIAWLSIAATPLLQGPEIELPPDRIKMANGKKFEGVILRRNDETLYLGRGTRVVELPANKVASMEGPRVAFDKYLAKLKDDFGSPSSADKSIKMAQWCEENGLLRDVRMHYLRALLADADNEIAHKALGHRRLRGRWRVKSATGKLVSWTETLRNHKSFDDPWEITTSHFFVRAAGELFDVLNSCAELEQLYRSYYRIFQEKIGFYELQAPVEVWIYPTKADFPPRADTLDAYFDPLPRVMYTYFKDGSASRMVRYATQAIMHNTSRELLRNEPDIPAWIQESIASYMNACFVGDPGSPKFIEGAIDYLLFEFHHNSPKPDSIIRVLNYQTSDFAASSGQDTRYGMSYTLAHYLLHSGDEERRENFFGFLTSCYHRKGSMSHFKNEMHIRNLDDLEEAWYAYVADKLKN